MGRRTKGPRLIGVEKRIFDVIRTEKRIKPSQIVRATELSPRSVRHALKKLQDKELIAKTPDLYDLRSFYYYITN